MWLDLARLTIIDERGLQIKDSNVENSGLTSTESTNTKSDIPQFHRLHTRLLSDFRICNTFLDCVDEN